MRWVVGLELRGLCEGATAWALALTHAGGHALFGVHVTHRPDTVALAQRALREFIEDCSALGRFTELRAAEAERVHEALADAVQSYRADGLILGRTGPRDGSGWSRLGSVARRLVRNPPGPLFVVAPDFGLEHLGAGPVVAATCLRSTSVPACLFAATVAELLDRELQLVHVAPSTAAWHAGPLGPSQRTTLDEAARTDAAASLEAFAKTHALRPTACHVLQGEPIDELLTFTSARDPAAVVVGSRRLGTIARLFTSSVGAELAAEAACPIAIVPPEPAEAPEAAQVADAP